MKSMTGHGWGECAKDGFKVTVELSSVNRKQSEIAVVVPREFEVLEAQIRDEINQRVARGRLTARVSIHTAAGKETARAHLNLPLARAYAREFNKLARELKIADVVSLDALLRAPGVLESDAELADAESFWPAVARALRKALSMLVRTREREGAHLQKDLRHRIDLMRRAVARVSELAPQVQQRFREALLGRIQRADLTGVGIDPERVNQEVVLFADRSDITEELTRLQSHFQQFDDCLKSKEPVGRKLDFLAQEMNREINTIGSKANDACVSREVVELKTELEKFREQAQNVE
jgi:uncharacterized protein (TIGR00255 family)